jgi:uncharacterized protein (DUF2252 family)
VVGDGGGCGDAPGCVGSPQEEDQPSLGWRTVAGESDNPSPDDRVAAGRALRTLVPRSSHGEWSPAPDRADPFTVLEHQARTRLPELRDLRYARMAESPFAFFRGAAAVMAMDLSSTPTTGLRVQACGDAHVNNFGFFASPERNLVFDINDFDETLPGPWEWDIKRLCASLQVLTRQRGLGPEDCRSIVTSAAATYRQRMADYSTWSTLDLFYERTEIKQVVEHFPLQQRSHVRRDVKRARRKDHLRAVSKLTEVVDGVLRFKEDPPLVVALERTGHDLDEALELISRYRSTLNDDRLYMFDRYRLLDVARKVVGVGSVGTRCWIGLFEGPDDPEADLIVIQAKEAQASVLEPYVGPSTFSHDGKRVVVGQRLIQAASDIFLGWTEGHHTDRSYYLRQLWDYKGQGDVLTMKPGVLRYYGTLCAWILARSHARTGDAVKIAAYLGTGSQFERAIARFSERYALVNEADHAVLVARTI